MTRHLLSLLDLSADEVLELIHQGQRFKKDRRRGKVSKALKGKTLGLIFEKESTRTRVSFAVAMAELGGHFLIMEDHATQLSRGESYADTARVLSSYLHGLAIRTHAQSKLEELARFASIPVINALSDLTHPCQLLADLMTICEERGSLKNVKVAYVGDGNNMANSWIEAATLLGFTLTISTPKGFEPEAQLLQKIGVGDRPNISLKTEPAEAVRGVDVIATDTWFSMGQEASIQDKRRVFAAYQVNEKLLSFAAPEAMVLHCLPAHRGEEITDGVMEGPHSRVLQEAENRLHMQKAVLVKLIKS